MTQFKLLLKRKDSPQIRLATSSDIGHGFNHAITLALDEPSNMNIMLYIHMEYYFITL